MASSEGRGDTNTGSMGPSAAPSRSLNDGVRSRVNDKRETGRPRTLPEAEMRRLLRGSEGRGMRGGRFGGECVDQDCLKGVVGRLGGGRSGVVGAVGLVWYEVSNDC